MLVVVVGVIAGVNAGIQACVSIGFSLVSCPAAALSCVVSVCLAGWVGLVGLCWLCCTHAHARIYVCTHQHTSLSLQACASVGMFNSMTASDIWCDHTDPRHTMSSDTRVHALTDLAQGTQRKNG